MATLLGGVCLPRLAGNTMAGRLITRNASRAMSRYTMLWRGAVLFDRRPGIGSLAVVADARMQNQCTVCKAKTSRSPCVHRTRDTVVKRILSLLSHARVLPLYTEAVYAVYGQRQSSSSSE